MHRKLTSLFSSLSAHLWFKLSDQSVSLSASSSFSSDQHLIIGAEEGIYTMNLNSSETTMELVKKNNNKPFCGKNWLLWSQEKKKRGLCWCTSSEYTDFFSFFQLYPGKCTWVYTISNVLMSISGKSNVGNTNKYWITTELSETFYLSFEWLFIVWVFILEYIILTNSYVFNTSSCKIITTFNHEQASGLIT